MKILPPETENFKIKKLIFFVFLTSTHNLCFWAEIRKNNVYLCKPPFYYVKVGFRGGGVKII